MRDIDQVNMGIDENSLYGAQNFVPTPAQKLQ